jgi:hypothetical protein
LFLPPLMPLLQLPAAYEARIIILPSRRQVAKPPSQ